MRNLPLRRLCSATSRQVGKYNNYAGQEEEEGEDEDDKMGTTIYGSGLFVGTLLFTKLNVCHRRVPGRCCWDCLRVGLGSYCHLCDCDSKDLLLTTMSPI